MSNTRDIIGEEVLLRKLVDGSITELEDDLASELRYYAFYKNSNITSIKLPNCKKIGSYAFYDCLNLKTLEIPRAREIGASALYNLFELEELRLNVDYNTNIVNCPKLSKLDIGPFILNGDGFVRNCGELTELTLICSYNGWMDSATMVQDCNKLETFFCKSPTTLNVTGCSNLKNYIWKCTSTKSSGGNYNPSMTDMFCQSYQSIKNIVFIFQPEVAQRCIGYRRLKNDNGEYYYKSFYSGTKACLDACENIYLMQDDIDLFKEGIFAEYADKIVAVEGSEFEEYTKK